MFVEHIDLACNLLISSCAVLMTVSELTFAEETKCADKSSLKDHGIKYGFIEEIVAN